MSNFDGTLLVDLEPFLPPLQTILQIPGEMAQHLTKVIELLPTVGIELLTAPLSVAFGTSQAFADSTQSVIDAFNAGETLTALSDLASMPAIVTGALLNGFSTPGFDYLGILSSAESPVGSGLLDDLLVQIPQEIAHALGASAPSSAAALLDPALLDPAVIGDIGANLGNMVADLLMSI